MPYSVNEDTGLLNYPLLRAELEGFRPWQASIHLARVRDFWRVVPKDAYGGAGALLEEVVRPCEEQVKTYPPVSQRPAGHANPGRGELAPQGCGRQARVQTSRQDGRWRCSGAATSLPGVPQRGC
jgi:hypothetical protein